MQRPSTDISNILLIFQKRTTLNIVHIFTILKIQALSLQLLIIHAADSRTRVFSLQLLLLPLAQLFHKSQGPHLHLRWTESQLSSIIQSTSEKLIVI